MRLMSKALRGLRPMLAVVLLFVALPAQAKWLRAESPRFVVYSDGWDAELRTYILNLELFDSLLRTLHNLPVNGAPPRKLEIYLVRDDAGLHRVSPRMRDGVVGFYSASVGDIFAVAERGESAQLIIQHEYSHHFMYQYFPYGYPAWLIEGYAEFFANTKIRGSLVDVGAVGDRSASLVGDEPWLPLEVLLAKPVSEIPDAKVNMFYAQSWLLTHYLMSEPARYAQMQAYMRAVGEGKDSVGAMQTATGLSTADLTKALRVYVRGALKYRQYKASGFPVPPVTITTLSPSADVLLLESQQLRAADGRDTRAALTGSSEAEVKAAAAEASRKAGLLKTFRAGVVRFPDDRMAQIGLAHAEIQVGDRKAGETLLAAWLAAHPDDVEALALMAGARMADGDDTPESRMELYREAGKLLARAYKADPTRYQTLFAYALTRTVEDNFPTDATLTTLREAHAMAPQVDEIGMFTAQVLMTKSRYAEAAALLKPIANDPHGGGTARAARGLLEQAQSRAP